MLQTIAIVLVVLWILGLISGNTLGGWVYGLLVAALILFLVRYFTGRGNPP